MKVLYFPNVVPFEGSNRSLLTLMKCLRVHGVEPFVCLHKSGPLINELEKENIPYRVIRAGCWLKRAQPSFSEFCVDLTKRCIKSILNPIAEIKIANLIKNEHINLVHINTIGGGTGAKAAHKAEIPVVWHIRELLDEHFGLDFYNRRLACELIQKSGRIIAISDTVLSKYSSLLRKGNLIKLYNGIDINSYIIKNRKILSGEIPVLSLVGRIEPGKGQLTALEAADIIANQKKVNFELHFYGRIDDSCYEKTLLDFIESNNLTRYVKMHGFTDNVRSVLESTDISLVCSKAEAFGRVTVEAMLGGTLVIGNNSAGTAELIRNGITGFKYCSGSPESLAEKILYAIENPKKAREIALTGQSYMEKNMTAEQNAAAILKVYNQLVKKCDN